MREYLATLLGAGLLTFPFLGQSSILQAPPAPTLQKAPAIELKKSESKVSKRHRVQVQVVSLSDLKISEGSQVAAGQIISDRTEERQSLEAERNQIDNAIKQLSIPASQLAELPPPNFAVEEAAIEQLKNELQLLDSRPSEVQGETFFRFKDENLQKVLEPEKLEKVAQRVADSANNQVKLAEAKAKLAGQLNSAIAALNKAKSNYQHQQYEHSLNLVRQQAELQRQQYQIASLVGKKQEIEAKLREITQIKSPVDGRVRRIKNLGQKDRAINLEVVIDIFTATSN
jgi:chaperonin cofactor prefoldin